MKTYDNVHDAYLASLKDVYFNPEYKCAPRGQAIRECTDYSFRVSEPSCEPIVTHDDVRNAKIVSYTAKEMELYLSGTNKASDFAQASKFWNQIANADGTVNSAYGHLIWKKKSLGKDVKITPWNWCLNSLKADKDTRQAVLRFSLPEHHYLGNKDFVCTLQGNFMIRDDKLNLAVSMRSNDMVLGLVYDMPFFCHLIDQMVDELKETYPDLKKGSYTHFAHSLHIYERNEADVLSMLGL
jgi:thymidylate synthase